MEQERGGLRGEYKRKAVERRNSVKLRQPPSEQPHSRVHKIIDSGVLLLDARGPQAVYIERGWCPRVSGRSDGAEVPVGTTGDIEWVLIRALRASTRNDPSWIIEKSEDPTK